MASRTGPDLAPARAAVEALQDDACIITRGGTPVLNQATGKLEAAAGATVYSAATLGEGGRSLADTDGVGGRCSINYPSNAQVSHRDEGGRQVLDATPEARIPLDAPVVLEGDILTVVSSRRDPQLVNKVFRVTDVTEKTFVVSRRLVLEHK